MDGYTEEWSLLTELTRIGATTQVDRQCPMTLDSHAPSGHESVASLKTITIRMHRHGTLRLRMLPAASATGSSLYTTYSGYLISGSFTHPNLAVRPGHERQVRREVHQR